ncbi:hypothetical protein IPZ60_04370 [Psychrobacter sp. NG25]|uniref:hypothetical protein n=1 Tax=Psychrobacter sp. NG25 TaxID=2782005 RepID=UPI0018845E86|nr:hypothetical protein [Psychrobacter sp. NG25]MBF0657971.1 hypothetical protein [Psychrobacter sp. NG25]
MSIFSKPREIESKYKIKLHEGESFKQAVYNGEMTDSEDCIIDKIELILKNHPDSQDISTSTYQSDDAFCYVMALP